MTVAGNATRQSAALLLVGAVTVLGAVAWLAFATGRAATENTAGSAGGTAGSTAPPTVAASEPPPAPSPSPTPSPPAVIATPAPPPAETETEMEPKPGPVRGLHVLSGDAHLLLTPDTYFTARTPEEVQRLTALLGPPVTRVDPARLPSASPKSVTDALDGLTR